LIFIVIIIILLAVVVGKIRGGRFEGLADLQIQGLPWIFLALGMRLATAFLAAKGIELTLLQIVAYCLFAYVLWRNLKLPGMKLFALGVVLNFLVIFINGGMMPVSAQAIAAAGLPEPAGTHMLLTAETKLWFLADIIPLPVPFLARVISIGDILIYVGIFYFIQKKMLPRQKQRKTLHFR